MKILVDLAHPAHIHLFKHAIWELQAHGHACAVTARDKEILLALLDAYGFPYETLSRAGNGVLGVAGEMMRRDWNLLRAARRFSPDLMMGVSTYITHVGTLLRIPSLFFTDTEHASISNSITFPFADVVCTPNCYRGAMKNQIRYRGYHELAYLHPRYFTPDPAVLRAEGLSPDDTLIIMRFVGWQAAHDRGARGLSLETKRRAVEEFSKRGRVLITSERPLPPEFEPYRISVGPDQVHHLMAYATLLYGESATMASEAAVLGTHAVFCDFAGRGYTDEEESKYGLVANFKLDPESQRRSVEKAVEWLDDPRLRNEGQRKRKLLLADTIDVTRFIVWLAEHYPESRRLMQERPDYQETFRTHGAAV
jgi:predicted glycosyltransferase